jgi:ankyrin repeat protein/GTPase SAR1 family protein
MATQDGQGHHQLTDLDLDLEAALESGDVDFVTQFIDAGGDPNTVCNFQFPREGYSILSLACEHGYIDLVKLLVLRGANIEHRDSDFERTPFLIASIYGHVPVLNLLLELQCNKNARTKMNNGALAVACWQGHLDALQFLVDFGHLAVNEEHQNARTPLHWAARNGHIDVCSFLLERHANINSQDQYLQTALHKSCKGNHVACAELLISKGADPKIKDMWNKMPHEYARGNLCNIVQFANLYSGGTVCLECLKICLMGDERAGKTTLAKAIKRTWDEHLSSLEEIAMDSIDICERTAGMTICKTTIPSMGPTVVCDFAGQELFHHTHNMFFDESNSLCIMVVSGLLRKNEMFGQCRRWAAFLTAASSAGAIPVVTVVVSRRDACSNIFQVEAMTQGVVTELKGMFKSVLNIQERYFILDCRKSQSPEMVKFREFLGELKEQKLETVRKYPRLVEPVIESLLPRLSENPSTKLIEKAHFTSFVKAELEFTGLTGSQLVDDTVEETIAFLHKSGEVCTCCNTSCNVFIFNLCF